MRRAPRHSCRSWWTRAASSPPTSPASSDAVDGINIKLAKCGSLREALRMIATARAHGMLVMVGCMIETSLGITAAAHFTPLRGRRRSRRRRAHRRRSVHRRDDRPRPDHVADRTGTRRQTQMTGPRPCRGRPARSRYPAPTPTPFPMRWQRASCLGRVWWCRCGGGRSSASSRGRQPSAVAVSNIKTDCRRA